MKRRRGGSALALASFIGRARGTGPFLHRLIHLLRRQQDDRLWSRSVPLSLTASESAAALTLSGQIDDPNSNPRRRMRNTSTSSLPPICVEVLLDRLAPADAAFLLRCPWRLLRYSAPRTDIWAWRPPFPHRRADAIFRDSSGANAGVIAWRQRTAGEMAKVRSRRPPPGRPRRWPPRSGQDTPRARSHRADR